MTTDSTDRQLTVAESRDLAAVSEARRDLIKRQLCPGASDLELDYFLSVSRELGLSPISKEIYAIMRRSKDQRGNWVEKMTIQIGIDGFRAIGARTGRFGGMRGPYWCGEDGVWKDIWTAKEPPAGAKVEIVLADTRETVSGIATWEEFKQETPARAAGSNNKGESWPARPAKLADMWEKMPAHMLAKCAEAQAWRKAIPSQTKEILNVAKVEFAPAEPLQIGDASPPSVTVNLNPSDTFDTFQAELEKAGWDIEEACRQFGTADLEGLQRLADRFGGWPQMTLKLRTLLAKMTRDALVAESMAPLTPEQRREGAKALYDSQDGIQELEERKAKERAVKQEVRSNGSDSATSRESAKPEPVSGAPRGEAPGDANVAPPHASPAGAHSPTEDEEYEEFRRKQLGITEDRDSGAVEAPHGDAASAGTDGQPEGDGEGAPSADPQAEDVDKGLGLCVDCAERAAEVFWGEDAVCPPCADLRKQKQEHEPPKEEAPKESDGRQRVPFPNCKGVGDFKMQAYDRLGLQPKAVAKILGENWDKGVRANDLPKLWEKLDAERPMAAMPLGE